MADITLSFPDGSKHVFPAGTTVIDVAKSISISLAKKAVAGKFNDVLVDDDAPLNVDGSIEIITKDSKDGLQVLRQTTAFILADALHQLYPKMHFGESKAEEDGFFYDTDNQDGQLTSDDLDKVTAKMKEIIASGAEIKVVKMSKADAQKLFADDPYKLALLDKAEDEVVMHQLGDFNDFVEGVVLPNVKDVKHFALLSVSGAYWQGKSSNAMLQRVYGTAYYSAKELEEDAKRRQEARERDHRVIGNDLDLFFVDPKVGAGLPYWMPNGATIRRIIERYITDKEIEYGYQHVYTPVVANLDLYKQSGHWAHYKDDMFPPMKMADGEELELRPMNCPSHIQIYKHHIRSYRDLPLRIAELGMMHRYEKSGALSGLQRVREMTLNDGHTFITPDQLLDEFKSILNLILDVYNDFNIKDYSFRLSYRDPKNTEKYFDDDEMWNNAQSALKAAMDDLGLDYVEAEGEAAFYGPKLDIQTKTAMGTEETMSTIQLDFMLPERFDLHYIGADGKEHRPVMLHRGVVGTMERFVAYLTEIYKGAFPTWLAPTQITIIPVKNDLHLDYAKQIAKQMRGYKLRVKIDDRNEKMNYKIREAQTKKIPYTLVVGDKEVEANTVTIRRYGEEKTTSEGVTDFIHDVIDEVANYSRERKN